MLRLSAAALGAVLCTFAPTLVTAQSAGAKPAADAASDALRLRELFGVTHPLQLVEFEAGGQKLAQPAGVLKSKQQATPYQQLANGKVVLLTGLPANSDCEWQLATAAAAPDGAIPNPVVVTKDGKTYRIENGLTGVAIRAEGSAAQMAPIQGIRYRDAPGPRRVRRSRSSCGCTLPLTLRCMGVSSRCCQATRTRMTCFSRPASCSGASSPSFAVAAAFLPGRVEVGGRCNGQRIQSRAAANGPRRRQ